MLNAIFPSLPLKMRTLVNNLQCLECFFKYIKFNINLNWGSKQIPQNTKAKVILTVHCCYLEGDGQHKNLEQAIWETRISLVQRQTPTNEVIFWILTGNSKKEFRHAIYKDIILFFVDTNTILNWKGQTNNIPHKWFMYQVHNKLRKTKLYSMNETSGLWISVNSLKLKLKFEDIVQSC